MEPPSGHPRFPGDEITRIGEAIYENKLRSLVETEENIGKIISIDIETGDYAIGKDLFDSGDPLHARHPGAAVFAARIGYNAVFAVGGSLRRTAP